jgi:hypothetical protein
LAYVTALAACCGLEEAGEGMSRTKASVEVSSHITMEVARVTHCSIRLNKDTERLKIDKVITTIARKHAYTEKSSNW